MYVRVVVAAALGALGVAAVAEAPSRARTAHARAQVADVRPTVAIVAAPPAKPRLVAVDGIREAQAWARRRGGTVGFAVARAGAPIRGINVNHRFYSASVVKAMLALAVVRAARDRALTAGERSLLRPMVTYSDNDAATAVYARVGSAALYRIARAAGMTRFDVSFNWADALLTARDQARLFLRIDRLAPRRHRAYLRALLGSVVPSQRWGIAPVAEARGFRVMFKGGWRTGIYHQVALLERDGRRIAVAVLTSGTDHGYGRETQSGIAARVLARAPRKRVSRSAAGAA